jgi:hypothetical protein
MLRNRGKVTNSIGFSYFLFYVFFSFDFSAMKRTVNHKRNKKKKTKVNFFLITLSSFHFINLKQLKLITLTGTKTNCTERERVNELTSMVIDSP